MFPHKKSAPQLLVSESNFWGADQFCAFFSNKSAKGLISSSFQGCPKGVCGCGRKYCTGKLFANSLLMPATGTNSGEVMPLCFTFAVLILNRHFHRHFYGNGATIGKEDLHTSTQLFMYFEAFAKKPIQLRTLSDGKTGRFCNAKSLAISCTYKKFTLNHIGLLEVIQYCTLL